MNNFTGEYWTWSAVGGALEPLENLVGTLPSPSDYRDFCIKPMTWGTSSVTCVPNGSGVNTAYVANVSKPESVTDLYGQSDTGGIGNGPAFAIEFTPDPAPGTPPNTPGVPPADTPPTIPGVPSIIYGDFQINALLFLGVIGFLVFVVFSAKKLQKNKVRK